MANDPMDIFHDRANHEDNLHVNRSSVFINLNGFFGVAVGIIKFPVMGLIFSVMILVVDVLWTVCATDAPTFIRELRDAGGERADEELWKKVHMREGGIAEPLAIMSRWMPLLLTLGWIAILIYFIAVLRCHAPLF